MAKFYSTTLRMSVLGQQAINRWDYFVPGGGTPTALELLTLMGFVPFGTPEAFPVGTVAGIIQSLLSVYVGFLEVQVEELYTPTDFYTAAFSPEQNGGVSENISSITDAFGLYSNRVRTDIKRGFKRLPGVPSNAYAGSSQVDPGYLALLNTLAEAMSVSLTGDSATYLPAVFQFQAYTTPSGRTAYHKYVLPADQAEHVAAPLAWTPYDTIRTQVSRQIGRGS